MQMKCFVSLVSMATSIDILIREIFRESLLIFSSILKWKKKRQLKCNSSFEIFNQFDHFGNVNYLFYFADLSWISIPPLKHTKVKQTYENITNRMKSLKSLITLAT